MNDAGHSTPENKQGNVINSLLTIKKVGAYYHAMLGDKSMYRSQTRAFCKDFISKNFGNEEA